jgi:hypothetical protein
MAHRLLPLLALVAIALGLVACGEADDSGGAPILSAQALANVADTTTAKGGVRMSMRQTMRIPGLGTVPSDSEGVFDTKTGRGEMTLSMDLSGLPDAARVGGGGSSEQHMIFDGLTFYMSSPALAASLPAGKRWIKIDVTELGKQAGVDFGSLIQGGSQDPTQVLQYLKAASGDVRKVGTEKVRGTRTTHYKATIDFNKVADTLPADRRAAVRATMRELIRLAGTSKAPMEVWIGDDGVLRRMTNTVTSNFDGQRTTITQRIELYDFGTKVDVKIPRASESIDASNLGAALAGALGVPS